MTRVRSASRVLGALIVALVFSVALAAAAGQQHEKPAEELPDGEGKKILQAACTSCHELDEVTKLRGFYTKAQWRDLVTTMVEYGAELKKGEGEVLVEYLAQHLGRKP